MLLSYNKCRIDIEDNLVKCSYTGHFDEEHWQVTLNDADICYSSPGEKERRFKVSEIQEFQFEMDNSAVKYGDIPAAIAYVILKTDTDPKDLFYFSIGEEYVLLNQTKAYGFCNKLLNYIGERYGISVNYKLSIDTKKKQKAIALVPLLLVIIFFLLWLRFKFLN